MTFRVNFKDRDYGWANWAKGLRFLGGKQSSLDVGLLEGITDPETIFHGAVNEVGVPSQNIPERAWFRNNMDDNADYYLKLIATAYVEELERGMPGGDARIKVMIGEQVSEDLKESIVNFTTPENAEKTIRKKGFDDPLVEKGNLSKAPTYRIKKPGEQ